MTEAFHTEQHATERVSIDRLLETCLVAAQKFKHFLQNIDVPPSEDFLLDRAAFEKQAERLLEFDVDFGKLMNGREANEDWRCLQGMRTALSGVLLLLAENCYTVEAPAMEELCEEFEEWIEEEGREAWEQVQEMVEELKRSPATAFIEEWLVLQTRTERIFANKSKSSSPFIAPAYTPSEIGSDSSVGSDADYMTPLQSQSRVSSFGTVYSDDGAPDYLVDLTAVIERFGVYINVLADSLELVSDILKWNYDSNLEKFEVLRAGAVNRPLGCIQVQCEKVFAHSEELKEHVERCGVRGVSFPVMPFGKTTFEAATLKCPITSCSAPFSSWEKLRQHQDLAHKIFICSYSGCGVAFFSWDLATEHVEHVHRGNTDLQESWMTKDISQWRTQSITFYPDHSQLFDLRLSLPDSLRRADTLPSPISPSSGPNFNFEGSPQPGLLRQPTHPPLGRSRSQSDVKRKSNSSASPKSRSKDRSGGYSMQRTKSAPGLNRHQKSESLESVILMLRSPWALKAPGSAGLTIHFS